MHPSSDSTHSAAAGPLLQLLLVVVLVAAGFAGMVVTVNAHLGLLALGFSLVAGPVGVVVEDRTRVARRVAPASRVPTPNAQPFSVPQAGGPDGKIWFTERSGRKIGTMTFP